MTEDETRAFLGQPGLVLNVASIGRNGNIDLVAMWYGFTSDGSVAFTTFVKSQKVVNWHRDPRFTALVEDGDRYEELRGVELVGRVELVDDDDEKLVILQSVVSRYRQRPEAGPAAEDAARRLLAKRVGVKLLVDKTISWDHRKLGGVYCRNHLTRSERSRPARSSILADPFAQVLVASPL